MIYDSEKITAELISRRDEIRKKRRVIHRAGACCIVLAAVLISAAAILFADGRGKNTAEAAVPSAPPNADIPRGDVWYGEEHSSEGWYNAPLDSGFETLPESICVRLEYGGEDMICNFADGMSIGSLTELIGSLTRSADNEPTPGREGIDYVVLFSKGRLMFRLTKYADGRFDVNDRGTFKLDPEREREFSGLIYKQASAAASKAKRSELMLGDEIISAYIFLPVQ